MLVRSILLLGVLSLTVACGTRDTTEAKPAGGAAVKKEDSKKEDPKKEDEKTEDTSLITAKCTISPGKDAKLVPAAKLISEKAINPGLYALVTIQQAQSVTVSEEVIESASVLAKPTSNTEAPMALQDQCLDVKDSKVQEMSVELPLSIVMPAAKGKITNLSATLTVVTSTPAGTNQKPDFKFKSVTKALSENPGIFGKDPNTLKDFAVAVISKNEFALVRTETGKTTDGKITQMKTIAKFQRLPIEQIQFMLNR